MYFIIARLPFQYIQEYILLNRTTHPGYHFQGKTYVSVTIINPIYTGCKIFQ